MKPLSMIAGALVALALTIAGSRAASASGMPPSAGTYIADGAVATAAEFTGPAWHQPS